MNDIEFKGEPNLIQKCIVSNQIIIEVENFPNQQKIQLRSSHEYHKLKIIPIHKKHYNNKCRTKLVHAGIDFPASASHNY